MTEEQKKAEANESENNASNTTDETAKQVEKDAAKQSADKKESESKEAKAAARPEAEAKKAAAARPERAKPSAAKKKDAEEEKPKPPSPNQPLLDRIVEIIRKEVSEDAVQEAFINEMDRHLPCIVIDSSRWVETSKLLKEHDQLSMVYLRNVTGVDYETHFA